VVRTFDLSDAQQACLELAEASVDSLLRDERRDHARNARVSGVG
jgi:hypothetical protein